MNKQKRESSPRTSSCSGFTLLELIAVIAIILILAALGLSSAKVVTEASNKVSCVNNLKQLHALTLAFTQDNNGYLPTGRGKNPYDANDDSNTDSDVTFIQTLWPYAYPSRSWASIQPVFGTGEAFNNLPIPLRKTIFECPGALDDPDSISVKRSYAINQRMGDGNVYTHDRQSRIPGTSKVALFADSKSSSKLSIETINIRHNGTANTVFLDGHIEAFVPPKKFTYTDVFWGTEP